jgi:dihydroneopterin aldolase
MAPIGMYPQELLLQNHFTVDVDIYLPLQELSEMPFVDYSLINETVQYVFKQGGATLEQLTAQIYDLLKARVPEAQKIRIAIKKHNPPMPGQIDYALVVLEH